MNAIKKIYEPSLMFALRHAKALLVLISVLFIGSLSLLFMQGREFMPELNEESIMYRVIAIPGTGLTQSVETAKAIEKHLLKTYPKEVLSVLSMAGRSEKGGDGTSKLHRSTLNAKSKYKKPRSINTHNG